ncbi:hypothetical protein Asi02nite_34020 [Asanoa siamensis]|uniref:Uncharacterized protein n=1 Tax=Asanoa siamensis TaxID=926357 RepID=A0ABQ4CRH6_9ACTN|nr:hypothetical protein Asi02nite_34020 [Asanoa siamensis]
MPSAAGATDAGRGRCAADRPGTDFYAAGRVASVPVAVHGCGSISVSHVRDVRAPNDRCQTFLLMLQAPGGGEPVYTTPVRACATPPHRRTVLATGLPDGTVFRVLYEVDYIDPEPQRVAFTVWS